jgi:hypothetical protein
MEHDMTLVLEHVERASSIFMAIAAQSLVVGAILTLL